MAKNNEPRVLVAEIRNTMAIVIDLYEKHKMFQAEELQNLGEKPITASYLADLLDTFYTCLETAFLRISHFFENELDKDRWHQDLLEKMRIEVPGLRVAVLSESSYQRLLELLRFRHFRRYYFEMKYDWDKLEYLQKKLLELEASIKKDFKHFLDFLNAL